MNKTLSTRILTLSAITAALALAGCTKTENSVPDGSLELRLTSAIEIETRADNGTQATQIASGEKVYVWVSDDTTNKSLYEKNELTSGDDGSLSGGNAMYYPQTGNGVNVSAFHGKFSFANANALPTSVSFSVEHDQSTAGSAYTNSDLLYACRNAKRSSSAVSLKFYHMLSKLELNISKSSELTDEISSVTLDGVIIDGTFSPLTSSDISTESTRAGSISAGTSTANMSLGTLEANEAIVVPQSLSGKTLTFTLESGGKLIYTFPTDAAFVSGKKHIYTVTLKLTGVSVQSEIENWGEGSSNSGDATMP